MRLQPRRAGDSRVALFNLAGTATLEPATDIQTIVEVTRGFMNIDTGSGDVDVRGVKSRLLHVATGSGSIDTDVPLTAVHRDHGELRGQMGDGRGRIVIETGAGGIRFAGR